MKNKFIITGLLIITFIVNCALAYEKIYNQQPISTIINKKIQSLKKDRYSASNYLAWDILRNQKGKMTGYSTPITSDAYDLLDPSYNIKNVGKRNQNNQQSIKSPTVQTDLFVLPGNGTSRKDNKGNKNDNTGGIAGRTGVTIIYD